MPSRRVPTLHAISGCLTSSQTGPQARRPPTRPTPSHPVLSRGLWFGQLQPSWLLPPCKTSATHGVPAWSGPSSQSHGHMFPPSRVHGPNPLQHGFNLNLPTAET
ncbi:hypothetical protein AAFF_G00107820 [Aldrovandia affinis]|uniref:Uncharacterized protein n=1 Tax=Aldrovandia affinis TaxID=143900 RepID=A0AAD7WBA8_9TELE|nr:hypothetical protein AAFF_G00107820 [Aldrovandia affinis]